MKNHLSILIILMCLAFQSLVAQSNKKSLEPFENLVVSGGGKVFVHYSPSTTLSFKGGDDCVNAIEVEQDANTLSVAPKNNSFSNCEVEIHISTPVLKKIEVYGGGTVEVIEGFNEMNAFSCSINGGGNVNMTSLEVSSYLASIYGGGQITANVSGMLTGKITGGGVVTYQGDPQVVSNISGGGAIRPQ